MKVVSMATTQRPKRRTLEIVHHKFVPQGQAVNAEYFYDVLCESSLLT